MVSPTFLAEVQRFCQTTSVRGVPRIVNSKSTLQSVIWLLGVLTCSCLLTWQMVVVFNRYFAYQVTTLLVQSHLSENVAFPDVTVCNLNPLVHQNEMNLTYTDYINLFSDKYSKNISNRPLNGAQQGYVLSSNGYFTNFPLPATLFIDNILQNSSIMDCGYYNWNGTQNSENHCYAFPIKFYNRFYQRWVPSFYKCYTLALNDSARTNIRGSSTIIYVDDFTGYVQGPFSSDIAYTASSGMQVLIHSPGSVPDMTLGIPIGVGMSTKIMIDQIKVTHLPYPFSNCTAQKTLGDVDKQAPYSVKYCTDVCLQKHYLKECGCLSSSMQFIPGQFHQSNHTLCGNLSLNNINSSINWEGVKQLICSTPIQARYQTACEYECVTPCVEYKYVLSSSAAAWPPKTTIESIYFYYIARNAYSGREFTAFNALKNKNISAFEYNYLLDELDRTGLVKRKFLQLSVQFNSRSFMEQKDVASFSFDAFGAQIGGVLSLWLGVTIILVFELCEVIINMLAMSFSAKRNKSAETEESTDTHL